MTLRLVGLFLTSTAVLVLLASMVLGLRGPAVEGGWQQVSVNRLQVDGERIRVEVLNGAGVSGLAQSVTERLRERGFDVVYFGNAGSLARDSTVVLDRGINSEAAVKVADELGIRRVEVAPDTSLYLEATIILAPDWEEIDRRN
jgi:thymidylate kinase